MIKMVLSVLCGATFYIQVRYPHLVFHCGVLTLATNMIWLWS